ncbi:MAG: hypothetical protein GC159_11740 [Phycisphaera sp.]|nr:hypothetical protein [Phycisphaera sp.]
MPHTASDTDTPLRDAADRIDLDVEAIAACVDAVLSDGLYWFPVRHHSPMVARVVQRVISQRRPRVIFLEAPSEAQHLVEHIVDSRTRPPIAIYSSFRDDHHALRSAANLSGHGDEPARYATWYPLLSYSPEYVTMISAKQVGAEVVFMDLPHWAEMAPARDGDEADRVREPSPHDVEQLMFESGFYRALADAAGYRTWDEAWDTLFEIDRPERDFEAFRRELATFCAAARATSSPQRIADDGTLARERHMRRVIRDTLAARNIEPADAMVVCGGFHLFMDHADDADPPVVPAGTVSVTAVPYSFFRVSELSGYASGNRAPSWYQTCYDLDERGATDADVLAEHVVATLKAARKLGEAVSPADAIAVTQHARLLANLRGRVAPILDDVHDALITCCCKGNPDTDGHTLRKAIDAIDIGTRVGKVTDRLGRLPLVADFYERLDALGLGEVVEREQLIKLDLDKRDELDAQRSAFLHRLLSLGVEIGRVFGAGGELGQGAIFRENWQLRWSPKLEPALVEKSLHGDTVERAATTLLRERLHRAAHDADTSCRRLVEAINMDLPDIVWHAETTVGEAIDTDGRFVSLSGALGSLLLLERYATYRALRRERLTELIERCYDRACFAVPEIAASPDDQWNDVVAALLALAEATMQRDGLDRDVFVTYVRQAAALSTVPFLRGALLGMLTEVRQLDPQALADELASYAQAPPEQMIVAGDFLNGVMAVSRTAILLGAESLVRAVDELLSAAAWEPFLTMLPRLRAAFDRLHDRQRDALAGHVARLYGLAEHESLTQIETSVSAAAMIADIDRRVAEIMKEWEL